MYEPYMSLIKQLFPNAKIIIDRFHIVQSLNRALNMSRVHVMNCYRTSNRPLYNKYKSYWKLFLKPFETLEDLIIIKSIYLKSGKAKSHYKLLIRCRYRII